MRLHPAAACLTLVLVTGGVSGCHAGPDPTGPVPRQPAVRADSSSVTETRSERPAVRALRLLHGWDRRRAAAFATSDARLLRRLYAPGSRAGARDLTLLRGYADRGLVVRGLAVQVLDARLRPTRPGLVRLRVVDRVVSGTVVHERSGGDGVALPIGAPVARVVTLERTSTGWVVRSVRPAA